MFNVLNSYTPLTMYCPRIIRELVGLWQEFKAKQIRKVEERAMFDWFVEKLIDRLLQAWYVATYNTSKDDFTREDVKNAVRWWSSKKKHDSFFNQNYEYRRYELPDHMCKEFEKKFPNEDYCYCFYREHHSALWHEVRRRIISEFF